MVTEAKKIKTNMICIEALRIILENVFRLLSCIKGDFLPFLTPCLSSSAGLSICSFVYLLCQILCFSLCCFVFCFLFVKLWGGGGRCILVNMVLTFLKKAKC